MDALRAASARSLGSIPFSVAWQDVERQLGLEFHFRTLRRLEDFGATSYNGIGLLFGSVRRASDVEISVVDVLLLATEASARLPLSPEVLNAISSRTATAEKRVIPVGLFFLSNNGARPPVPTDLAAAAYVFGPPVPVLVIGPRSGEGRVARLHLWSPLKESMEQLPLEFPLNWRLMMQRSCQPFTANFNVIGNEPSARPQLRPPENRSDAIAVERQLPHTQGADVESYAHYPPDRRDASVFRVPKWVAASVVAAAISGTSAWLYTRNASLRYAYRPAAVALSGGDVSDLGLEVSRQGSDLQVQWNRTSRLVRSASAGVLRVLDNDERLEIALDGNQLRTGRVLYTPKSPNVDLTLDLVSESGRVQETVRVIQAASATSGVSDTWRESAPASRRAEYSASRGTAKSGANAAVPAAKVTLPPPTPAASSERTTITKVFTLRPVSQPKPPSPKVDIAVPRIAQAALSAAPVTGALPNPLPAIEKISPAPPPVRVEEPTRSAPSSPPAERVVPPLLRKKYEIVLPPHTKAMLRGSASIDLKLFIDESGQVTRVEPVDGNAGNANLASAAAQSVRLWRYDPALLHGKPVASEQIVHLRFNKSK